MKKLIIYGVGMVAEVADFYFKIDTDYETVAFTNGSAFIKEERFKGKPLVPFEELERIYPPAEHELFIAVGYLNTNQIRQARYHDAKTKGYNCATYISPRATYYGTPVGENCFILENNVIQPFVEIGNNVTLWSGNHHSVIGDHCFISSHVVVSGGCNIGQNCFLGVNSTLRDNIKLDRFVVVSSGAVVMKHCEERTLVRPTQSSYSIVNRDLL
jgi:sugar O-acyltransferase (sialic acid O-acetyltransferase NeuD family)